MHAAFILVRYTVICPNSCLLFQDSYGRDPDRREGIIFCLCRKAIMEQTTGNKGFVAKGGAIVLVAIAIIIAIWFLVTRTNTTANKTNSNSNATDTGSTQGIPPDSLHH